MYRSGWLVLEPPAMGKGVDPARNHPASTHALTDSQLQKTDCPPLSGLDSSVLEASSDSKSDEQKGSFSVTRLTTLESGLGRVHTVGFGDITATSQTARVFVTVQMILDLIVLGL
jgi:hypothetical protein